MQRDWVIDGLNLDLGIIDGIMDIFSPPLCSTWLTS